MDQVSELAVMSLEECNSLYLVEIEFEDEDGVRMRVIEPTSHARYENLDRDFTPELAARLREIDSSCETYKESRLFEISFVGVVSYTVTMGDYLKRAELPEASTGRWLRVFSQSDLLNFARKTTFAEDSEQLGPVRHFQIACFDEFVDVITYWDPEVRQIFPSV